MLQIYKLAFSIYQLTKLKTNRANVVLLCKNYRNYSTYCCLELMEPMKQ